MPVGKTTTPSLVTFSQSYCRLTLLGLLTSKPDSLAIASVIALADSIAANL